ncbi:hypothetical protein BV898_03152 [Hypsibius exemplaris]|uniref:Uncharacterized protein n=1 Tax=Hypsibius exemplaris TaxID=2072580 RepID=A0A1W0X6C2_HYPEX|nr:hypothetical protein BV898_03152 [Hypsibius exemplaris]
MSPLLCRQLCIITEDLHSSFHNDEKIMFDYYFDEFAKMIFSIYALITSATNGIIFRLSSNLHRQHNLSDADPFTESSTKSGGHPCSRFVLPVGPPSRTSHLPGFS